MFSGVLSKVKKIAAQAGVVKTGEEDEAAKQRINYHQKSVASLRNAVQKYTKTFTERGSATAAVHDGMAELYPAEQEFSNNIVALISRKSAFKETSGYVEEMKKDLLDGLQNADQKLTQLSKMVQERTNLRIDIETLNKDIIKFEADGAKSAQKLQAAQAKLASVQERFDAAEAALAPELERLDKDIADLLTAALKKFIDVQITYNQTVIDNYKAGLTGDIIEGAIHVEEPTAPDAQAQSEAATSGPVVEDSPAVEDAAPAEAVAAQ